MRAGEVAAIDVPGNARQVRITDPDGRRYVLPVEQNPVLFDHTERRGVYTVEVGGRHRLLAVNLVSRAESDTRPRPKLRWGQRTIAAAGQGRATAHREIWRTFALLAALLLIFEWYAYHRRL